MEPEDTLFARIDTELYEAGRLLERGDADGARIAAWAARQMAERENLPDFAAECIQVITRCDAELGFGDTVDVRQPMPVVNR